MLEWKDITDILIAPIVAALGWAFKTLNDKPSREEVQRMIEQNNSTHAALLDALKDDILELKGDAKDTRKDIKEIRELIIKSFQNK